MVGTFAFMAYGFLIFRAHDLGQVADLTHLMFTDLVTRPADLFPLVQVAVLIALPLGLEIAQYRHGSDLDLVLRWPRPIQGFCVVVCVLCTVVLGSTYGQHFIYFQF